MIARARRRAVAVVAVVALVAVFAAAPKAGAPAAASVTVFSAAAYHSTASVPVTHSQAGRFYVEWNVRQTGYRAGDRAAYCVTAPPGTATVTFTASYVSNGYNHAFVSSGSMTHEVWRAGGVVTATSRTATAATTAGSEVCFGEAVDTGTTTYPAPRYLDVSAYSFSSVSSSRQCPASGPDSSCTGVPAGTRLTVHRGDIRITKAGTVIDGWDIEGSVVIDAGNVTIKRSRIRGESYATTKWQPVVFVPDGHSGVILEDDEIYVSHPSVFTDSVHAYNTTLLRDDLHGGVDGVKALDHTTVEKCYIHDLSWFPHDPAQKGGPTHNDDVQILGGNGITISGNTLVSATTDNSAIQVTQGVARVNALLIKGNHADGGACTFNLDAKPYTAMGSASIDDNRFGRHSRYNCPIIVEFRAGVSLAGNVWADTGLPVPVR